LNNYLGLVPREPLKGWLELDPDNVRTLHDLLASVPKSELELHGRRYISDLLKLEPSELKRVRITNPLVALTKRGVRVMDSTEGNR
jgi:hypothetical protein